MRAGLVVLAFGGPRRVEDVEPFLFALFDDPDVIHFPLGRAMQHRFAKMISRRRAPLVSPHYAHIGFSPLVPETEAQVEALRAALGRDAPPTWLGMRYTEPSTQKVADAIAAAPDQPERLIALALYPHWSHTTTASSYNALSAALRQAGLQNLPVQYIPAFYEHPRYVAAMKSLIEEAAAKLEDPARAHILFSAHGIPTSYAREGDPYPDQVKDSVRMIMRALGKAWSHSLAFQSRVGPVRWIKPQTEEELIRLARAGKREVIAVPISFTTEGIETLYEIDELFGEVAHRHGLKLVRTRALGTQPDFIACLADLVRSALADQSHGGIGAHRCVRCLLPKPHAQRTRVKCLDCGFTMPEYLLQLPSVSRQSPTHSQTQRAVRNDSG